MPLVFIIQGGTGNRDSEIEVAQDHIRPQEVRSGYDLDDSKLPPTTKRNFKELLPVSAIKCITMIHEEDSDTAIFFTDRRQNVMS